MPLGVLLLGGHDLVQLPLASVVLLVGPQALLLGTIAYCHGGLGLHRLRPMWLARGHDAFEPLGSSGQWPQLRWPWQRAHLGVWLLLHYLPFHHQSQDVMRVGLPNSSFQQCGRVQVGSLPYMQCLLLPSYSPYEVGSNTGG
jgi:hypothetical protein